MHNVQAHERKTQPQEAGHNRSFQRPRLAIDYVAIDALRHPARRTRKHSPKQIEQIGESIKAFGFAVPIIVDRDGRIIDGEAIWEAAKQLGMTEVAVCRLNTLSADEARALRLALNRLAENGAWNEAELRLEFEELLALDLELSFDLSVTGFGTAEIDRILESDGEADEAEPEASAPDAVAVSKVGDLWELGPHRLYVGDASKPESYVTLLQGRRAQLVLTDPPYNVSVKGHVSKQPGRREFVMASGEMSEAEFREFLGSVFEAVAGTTVSGAVLMTFMDWRSLEAMMAAGRASELQLLNLCVWAKEAPGMGSLYRSQHELLFVWKNGTAPHVNNVELGKHGRNRSNLWTYPGFNTAPGSRKAPSSGDHPTPKPVSMLVDAIKDVSDRNEVVLDPFLGSGSTLIACERTGRVCYGMELDPLYADLIIRRWQDHTGQGAVHSGTGRSFADLEAAPAPVGVLEPNAPVRTRVRVRGGTGASAQRGLQAGAGASRTSSNKA